MPRAGRLLRDQSPDPRFQDPPPDLISAEDLARFYWRQDELLMRRWRHAQKGVSRKW